MICALSMRRMDEADGTAMYVLRVTGKAAVGPSGTGGQDERRFPSQTALLQAMADMDLPRAVMTKVEEVLQDEAHTQRFVPVATDVQIPFAVLEQNDFYLEQ